VKSSKTPPAGSSAKVLPGAHAALVEAYGDVFSKSVREVYARVVVWGEPWFLPAGKGRPTAGVRGELIERGWSQREATTIWVTATAAQAAAVESTKLALARARQDVEVVEAKLEETSKKKRQRHKRHGLARRRDILASRVERLEKRLLDGDVRVSFGGRRLALAGNDPTAHGYADHEEWRAHWDRVRGGGFVCFGDAESPLGNYSARVLLGADGKGDAVLLRVPRFLRHLSGGEEWVRIPVVGFSNNRVLLEAATCPDAASHAGRVAKWEGQRELYERQRALVAAGVPTAVPKEPALSPPRLKCASAVTLRFSWNEKRQGWYVEASFERPVVVKNRRFTHVLGVDLDPDHLAWCLVKRDGNPLGFGRIDIDLSGTSEHNRDVIGCAVKALVAVATRHGAAISVENLDFARARAALRYSSSRLKRLLTSFAYRQFFSTLSSRCAREGVQLVSVNPAWSSVLGQANYAGVHGVSVDQGAACIIARRALGLPCRVRPTVARLVPRSGPSGQAHVTNADVGKALRSGPHARGRRSTWDADGFCLRRPPGSPLLSEGASMSSVARPARAGQATPAVTPLPRHLRARHALVGRPLPGSLERVPVQASNGQVRE
jgi:IS605 OrfB family transposase